MFQFRDQLARTQILPVLIAALTFSVSSLLAAPVVKKIDIRGLQIGATNTITIEGDDLAANPRLYGPIRILRQKANTWSANKVSFEVKLDTNVESDIYPFRVVTDNGVSNAFLLGVDRLPQMKMQTSVKQMPVALHGELNGSTVYKIEIPSKKGQRLVVDIEGQRLGSNIRPILRLYDNRGRQVTWAKPSRVIQGDARFQTEIPNDGTYLLELQDQVFKGPQPGFFRLKIGQLEFADFALPMSIPASEATAVHFASSNLENPVWVSDRSNGSDFIKVSLPRTKIPFTGARPIVGINRQHDEMVEQNVKMKKAVPTPVAISGCIDTKGEVDRFTFQVRPETKYRAEVISHRAGTSLDSVLTVKDKNDKQIASNDDHAKSLDPGLEFTTGKGNDLVKIELSSLAGNFGPDCVYRIQVSESALNGFRASTSLDSIMMESGNRALIPITIQRSGYQGKIRISLAPSSADFFQAADVILEPSDELTWFAVSAPDFAQAVVPLRLRATAVDHPESPSQLVRTRSISGLHENVPWHQELVSSVRLGFNPAIDWASARPSRLIQGTQESLGIEFVQETKVPVRVTLVTSQRMPRKKVNKKDVDDVARALRIDTQTLEPGASKAQVNLIVPADLPDRNWLFTVKAEFLSADKKNVVATDYTELLRVPSKTALTAKLASEAKPKIKVGDSAFVEFRGSVQRLAGFEFPVRVALTGLPKEYGIPAIDLAKDQSEFSLAIALRREKDAKKLQNLRLGAMFVNPENAKYAAIRSQTIPLEIELTK